MNVKVVDPSGMTMEELMNENLIVLSKGRICCDWVARGTTSGCYLDEVRKIVENDDDAGVLLRIIHV